MLRVSDDVLVLLLPPLVPVVVELVAVVDGVVVVTARTRDGPAVCTGCGEHSSRVHSGCQRQVADESVGGRPLRIDLSVHRLYCENPACPKVTFAEQVDGLTRRYQRRTPALQRVVDAVAVAPAGSAGTRLPGVLHHALSWAGVLNCLMRITVPDRPLPRVPGTDEFALRRGHRYATIPTCAETGARIDVLPDRKKETVVTWLTGHPGTEVVCQDGAGGFARAVTDADPAIVQVRGPPAVRHEAPCRIPDSIGRNLSGSLSGAPSRHGPATTGTSPRAASPDHAPQARKKAL